MRATMLFAAAMLALAGCSDEESGPYLEYVGGGFIFNYRNAEAFYGFVARPLRGLPDGSVIEVAFEMPHQDLPYVTTEKAVPGMLQYTFQSPQVSGVEKGHPYKVVMRLLDGPAGKELGRYEKSFHTDVEQASLPSKPLVIGPGYTPNPD
jgi:hypothetical protein